MITIKSTARVNRDKDTGWGYAWAHLVPIVPIYYAITRRTLTPILFIAAAGIIFSAAETNQKEETQVFLAIVNLFTTPVVAKLAIKHMRSDKSFGLE